MSQSINTKTADQTLNDYLDTVYLQSHSASSVKTYRTAIVGTKSGFRLFLQDCFPDSLKKMREDEKNIKCATT